MLIVDYQLSLHQSSDSVFENGDKRGWLWQVNRITSIAKCLQKLILSFADLAYVFLPVTKDCITHFVCCL